MSAQHEDDYVATKAWDSSLLRRLLAFARPHRRLFALSFLILLGLFALELSGPWIWKSALDGPASQAVAESLAAEDAGVAFERGPYVRAFLLWVGAYLVVLLVSLIFRYLQVAQLARTGQYVIADLRTALFRHIQKLDLTFFDKRPTGSLVTRVTSDVENLNEMFTSGIVVLLFDVIKVVGLLTIMYFLHWKLALVVTAGTPFLIGVSLIFRGGARRAHRSVRARLSRLNGYLQEALQGMRVVQVFGRERHVSGRFAGLLDDYLKANLRTIFLFALFFPTIDLVVSLMQGTTLWVGGVSIAGDTLTFGEFFMFWLYVTQLVSPIRELGERYNVLQSAFASAERIFDIFDTEPSIRPLPAAAGERAGAAAQAAFSGHVRFENVSFGYTQDVQVLHDVSFDIPQGSTIAVVGATGAGKSTLINLLLRFYDTTSGRITIDGKDLRSFDLATLRRGIGLVLQEDFLFAGTVHENLVMEREEVTEESLELALRASRADELVGRLSGGLDAPVAERGATFSTGERQLLAMARALAGDPELVLLDEATAAVDSATEAQIEAATRNLLRGRSALVIAHRLSTVRRADQILVLHKGCLREQGTHDELLAKGGLYAKLYAMQFSEQGDDQVAPT